MRKVGGNEIANNRDAQLPTTISSVQTVSAPSGIPGIWLPPATHGPNGDATGPLNGGGLHVRRQTWLLYPTLCQPHRLPDEAAGLHQHPAGLFGLQPGQQADQGGLGVAAGPIQRH